MICDNCKLAGDSNSLASRETLSEFFRAEMLAKANEYHTMCVDKGCFCQHRVGDMHIIK